MKNILVPCDFSEPAIHAFRFALDIAVRSKGHVRLYHVIELPAIHDPIIMPVVTLEQEFLKEVKEKALVRLNGIISQYAVPASVKATAVVDFGSPARMMTAFAEEESIDVIAMGSHGASGVKEYFIGSNAEKIVRRSSIPVLVIKTFEGKPIRNVVFPNTLETEKQEDLIAKVKELQSFFGASLHILYVNTPTHFTAGNITYGRLEAFAKKFGFTDYTLNVYNYPYEDSGIIQFAAKINADLIAMATHGRKGIAHFVNGSLAEDIVNHAQCPIWTYGIR
jgi:nucleotide-binding universal stress UspA family protein